MIGFFFEACIGMIGFWFLEVTSLLYVVNTLNFFVSGPHVPARPAAAVLGGLLKLLPFQYLAYFPAVVFLGKVQGPELVHGLLIERRGRWRSWCPARVLYRLGLRRYRPTGDDCMTGGPLPPTAAAFARFSLAREMAFRGNFLVKVFVEVLWLGILLSSTAPSSRKTDVVADWTEPQYLFFVGCYFALEGLIETFFLENCTEFAELIRSGDLDFYLLRPIDEQFLITCRNIDWSTAPNVLMGGGVMGLAPAQMGWTFDPPCSAGVPA